jgi:hypothetical protein
VLDRSDRRGGARVRAAGFGGAAVRVADARAAGLFEEDQPVVPVVATASSHADLPTRVLGGPGGESAGGSAAPAGVY